MSARITVPDDLAERDQWVLWRLECNTKVPYRPDGRRASITNPDDWNEFDVVIHALEKHPKHWSGTGFVFTPEDPFVGIDLDNCLEKNATPKQWARGIIARFSDTYMEVSPSGCGVKIFSKGKLPTAVGKVVVRDGGVEMYDRARYFTVTGNRFRGAPLGLEDHAADVLTMYRRLTRVDGLAHQAKYRPTPEGKIPRGARHNTLVSICGTLRRRRICEPAIEACLQTANRYQCEEPLPPEEITTLVRSTRRWSQG